MKMETAAATANCSMSTLRLAVPSSDAPVSPNMAMQMRMTQPLTRLPMP
jgi:hypothetical protein